MKLINLLRLFPDEFDAHNTLKESEDSSERRVRLIRGGKAVTVTRRAKGQRPKKSASIRKRISRALKRSLKKGKATRTRQATKKRKKSLKVRKRIGL